MDKFSGLYPVVAEAAKKVLDSLQERGIPCVLESGFRSFEEQERLYAIGRTASPSSRIVTNAPAGHSWHNFGLAVDLTRVGKDGKKTWDLPYMPIGEIGKEFGFEWGGDWTAFRDLPHLQMRFGFELKTARELVETLGLPKFWEKIEQKAWP